jgi:hypothetical protein
MQCVCVAVHASHWPTVGIEWNAAHSYSGDGNHLCIKSIKFKWILGGAHLSASLLPTEKCVLMSTRSCLRRSGRGLGGAGVWLERAGQGKEENETKPPQFEVPIYNGNAYILRQKTCKPGKET